MSTVTSTVFGTGEFTSTKSDYLVCGSCQRSFPLSDIVTFMQHKKFDCNDGFASSNKPLLCQSCPEKFITPWSLLQHAQNIHALKIYLESNISNTGIKQIFKNLSNNNVSSSVSVGEEIPKRTAINGSNAGIIALHGSLVKQPMQTMRASGLENQPQFNVVAVQSTSDDNPKLNLIAVKKNLSTQGNNQKQIVVSSNSLKKILTSQQNESKSLPLLSPKSTFLPIGDNKSNCSEKNDTSRSTEKNNHTTMQKLSLEEPTLFIQTQGTDQMPIVTASSDTQRQSGKGLSNSKSNLSPISSKDVQGQIKTKEANMSASQQAITYAQCDVGTPIAPVIQNKESELPKTEDGEGDKEDQICCDDQDCGVTLIPGTHEELKKCCSAVAPKKRKRHMETKHMSGGKSKKKNSDKKHQSNTIYIDFEPSAGGGYHLSQSSFSQSGEKVLQRKDGRKSDNRTSRTDSTTSQGSVIITPGSAFSLPISYTVSVESSPDSTNLEGLKAMEDSRKSIEKEVSHNNSPKSSADVLQLKTWPIKSSVMPSSEQEEQKKENQNQTSEMTSATNDGNQSQEEADQEKGKKRRYPTSRPFKCDKCGDAFNQRIHLKKHQSKHTGIKPFKCGQCDYSTVERSHLKVHIRVHTGEKPFKCTFCEYATAQNSTLKIHLKRHHNRASSARNQFQCSTCGKQFTQQEKLSMHSREHGQTRTLQEGLVIQTSEPSGNGSDTGKYNPTSPQSSLESPDQMMHVRHEDSENTNDS